jgi:hypothetical protein
MAAKKSKSNIPLAPDVSERVSALDSPTPIAGILGPGRWLVVDYDPTALFSLKISMATSSVGKTLVVPTPYAIKMALIDAAFRRDYTEPDCEALLRSLIQVTVRTGPGPGAVVTHTFVKVRQESRDSDPLRPYSSTIAYRARIAVGVVQFLARGQWSESTTDDQTGKNLLVFTRQNAVAHQRCRMMRNDLGLHPEVVMIGEMRHYRSGN